MALRDTIRLISPRDILTAIGLLSRLPVRLDTDKATARGAAAAWAFPLAGLVIGAIVATAATLGLWVGLSAPFAAGLALTANVIVTGAMHEDGLADSADGLWGGWDRARRLAIMKDSNIGVYGVCALGLALLFRWLALTAVIAGGVHWAAIITVAMVSRACITGIMAVLPHARNEGLSQSVGQPSAACTAIASVIGLAPCLIYWGLSGLLVALIAELAVLGCIAIARVKIGGQTGDILGATQQLTEIAALLTLVTLISS